MYEKTETALREAMHNKKLIPFVGAGVSQSAAGVPSWPTLATQMHEFVAREKKKNTAAKPKIDEMGDLINAEKLIDAFDIGQDLLGYQSGTDGWNAPKYRHFLEDQFGEPEVRNPSILRALVELRTRLIVTTNYDRLIEKYAAPTWESSTWLEPSKALSAIRRGEGVIHLHGRFDTPRSLVLSRKDYVTLTQTNEELLNHLASALFFSGVLLFIGTSLEGLQDPHLETILESFGKLSHGQPLEQSPHYYLAKGLPPSHERARLRSLGIEYISYGDNYTDLEPFLLGLAKRSRIEIEASSMTEVMQRVKVARDMKDLIHVAKDHIVHSIFAGRRVRVGYAAKDPKSDLKLLSKYLIRPPGAPGHFIYPAGFSGWALATGRITAYPAQIDASLDFEWLKKIGREERVRAQLERIKSELRGGKQLHYFDIDKLIEKVAAGTATMRDFFQDWEGGESNPHYRQFINVPVPVIPRPDTGVEEHEYGVFNIDSSEAIPLLTTQAEIELSLLSDMVHLCYLWQLSPVRMKM
jgi:SIR2-like domain